MYAVFDVWLASYAQQPPLVALKLTLYWNVHFLHMLASRAPASGKAKHCMNELHSLDSFYCTTYVQSVGQMHSSGSNDQAPSAVLKQNKPGVRTVRPQWERMMELRISAGA